LLVNLLLLVICRGLYVLVYVINYYSDQQVEGQKLFTRSENIYFIVKQITITLFCLLYLPIAAFIAFYSLLVSGGYLKKIGEKRNSKYIGIAGSIIYLLSPIIGLSWFITVGDILSVAAIGISIFVFLHYGSSKITLSLVELIEKRQHSFTRIPKAVHIGVFIVVIISSSAVFMGTAIYNPPAIQTVNIQMRDGIKLATDIYLAPGSFGQPRPVILVRTTYGKSGSGMYTLLYHMQGYHLVVQDTRGTFDSEDHEKFLIHMKDFQDGVDTIEWILEQSWCNGKIATAGASALANTQFPLAGMTPKGLVAQSLMIGTPDMYNTTYQGGAFREYLAINWITGVAPDNYEYQLEHIINHPKKDSIYNTTSLFMSDGPNFSKVNVSAIHVGGWYDLFQQNTLDGYMGYDDLGLEGARGKQLLIMGPFTHGFPREGRTGELIFPTKSISSSDLYLDWERRLFDHALLGMDFDWNSNRVAYYMMGDVDDESVGDTVNNYRYAEDWPVPHNNDRWYLNADRNLVKSSFGSTNVNYSYLYDPRDPVPTLGGTNLILPSGPYDQVSLENRDDILLFETPVLTEKIDVIGRMSAHFFVMSNCSNTDFTVKITDVYPDGRSMLVSDGIIKNQFNSSDPVEVVIDLWSTAYQFNTGHRIRISISSSNYPKYAINPNTGAPQELYSYKYLDRYIANNTILVGPAYPSFIILPNPIY
ncbi:MAG: CocE/NonD family hydrolase, partial [Candidatus Hodarchaeales archaeon]